MLRRGQEVVEAVLLVGEAAAVVPFLAVFAAAADVRDREHPALFDPRQPRGRESGGDGDVEPAIAVEDRRLRPGGQILAADHDHWHAGAVFRCDEFGRESVSGRGWWYE